jgi:hypothetical protein
MSEYSDPNNRSEIVTYPVEHGSYAVAIESDGSSEDPVISTSGLPYYPTDGDDFRYETYLGDGESTSHFYFASDSSGDNTYRVSIEPFTDELRIYLIDGGSFTDLGTQDLGSVPEGEFLEVEISWTGGGGFSVEVFNDSGTSLGSVSTGDSTYTGGGIGWAASSGVTGETKTVWFDYCRTISQSTGIEDFEDGDISEYSGDTGSATVKNSAEIPVEHGTYALEISGTTTIHAAKDQLNNDAIAGDTFESQHYIDSGGVMRFLFGFQDSSNYYFVEADAPNGNWTLGKNDGGTESTISENTSGFTVPTKEWAKFEVDWGSGGSMTAKLFDANGSEVASTSGSDSTWSEGGHGWTESDSSSTSYADYAFIKTTGSQTTGTDRSTGIVDDFEDNNLSEYSSIEGNTATQSNVVHDDTYAIRTEETSDVTRGHAGSMSGLSRYPQAGDTFQYWVRTEQGNTARMGFGLQEDTKDNGYEILFNDSKIDIRRFDNGSGTVISETKVSTSAATWYQHVVEWEESGNITATLYDESGSELASTSATDTTYSDGGISFSGKGLDGHKWYFDTCEITEVTDSTGIIDDYEDNDLSEYSNVTGNTAVQSNVVHDGTYAVRTEETSSEDGHAGSMSGLPRYPQAGDTFQYWARSEKGNSTEVGFGIQEDTKDNGYDILFNDSRIDIRRWDNDSVTALSSKSVSTSADTWYRIVVDWGSGGDLVATLYDESGTELASTSANDTNYSAGGISVGGGGLSGDKWYFDTFEITAVTSPTGIVDDFEDNDLSEYSHIEGNATVQSNVVHNGTYAVLTEETSSSDSGYAGSMSGLPRYPQSGDTFQYWVRTELGDTARTGFGLQEDTKDNGYDILFSDSKIEIRRHGPYEVLASKSVSTSAGTWYRHVVEWGDNGDITATLYDESGSKLATVSATDTNYYEGGISVSGKGGNTSQWYWDNIEVTSSE